MSQETKRTIKNILLVLVAFTLCFSYYDYGIRFDLGVISVFVLIGLGALSGLFLSVDKKAVSVNKTFCLFYYFFFCLAPIAQYKESSTFYFKGYISDYTYLTTGITILISLIIYLLVYRYGRQFFLKRERVNSNEIKTEESYFSLKLNYILVIISIWLYLYLSKYNWDLLIYRPYSFDLKNHTNFGLLGYSFLLVLKVVPFIILMNYVLLKQKKNKHIIFLFLLMLLVSFPTSLSRGVLAIMYTPLLVIFTPLLRKKHHYTIMYCLGILLVFPFFNAFREWKTHGFYFDYQLFNSGHFDAFQNFALLQKEKIITNGEQLFSSICFFTQENKPIGTGHLLAESLNFSHLNVAMPYIGEGYVNFGYLGIIAFIFVISLINSFLDSYKRNNKIIQIFIYLFLGYEFYLLRGDLRSSIKILMSFALALFLVFISNFLYTKLNSFTKTMKKNKTLND